MPFTPKDWRNANTVTGGGDTSTPLDAAALEDMETRLSAYTDTRVIQEAPLNAAWPEYNLLGDGSDEYTKLSAFLSALNAGSAASRFGYIPRGSYNFGTSLSLPVQSAGGMKLFGDGPGATVLNYTGTTASSYAIKLGGGTSVTESRWQVIEGIELVGNTSCEGGIMFDSTRFCGLKRVFVHAFQSAGGRCVRLRGNATDQPPNYFNRIEDCQFRDADYGVILQGETTAGTGANSNVISNCHFGIMDTACVWITGGDTNRLEYNEFTSTAEAVLIDSVAVYNTLFHNEFDGPTHSLNISASAVEKTQLLYNTGGDWTSAKITDAGTNTYRRDPMGGALPSIASAATITIRGAGNNDCFAVTGTANITSINPSYEGRIVRLTFTGTAAGTGLTDGAGTLRLNGNFVYTPDDTISLLCVDGTNWQELGRSVN